MLRSTWDYAERRDEFLAWVDGVRGVANPPEVVRWNTDKRYLAALGEAGVPVVPTAFVEPGGELEPPAERFVVKPAISAGGRNAASYEATSYELARRHLEALHAAGRAVMVQPYLEGVDVVGEAALIWLGGDYSHAVTKSALLRPGQRAGTTLYLEETIAARQRSRQNARWASVRRRAPVRRSVPRVRARGPPPRGRRPGGARGRAHRAVAFLGYEAAAAGRLADAIRAAL